MRYYSSVAVETTLSAPITGSATSIVVDDATGFPISYPYTLSIDADNGSKELVEVTNGSGTTLTVTRGVDGTSGISHALGAVVRHDHSARDFREPQEHIAASSGVHGVSGTLVGTSDTQALTNKDLSSGNTFPAALATLTGTQTLTNKDLTSGTNTFPTTLATLTGSQTLTNKDLTSGTNTFPTSLATLTGTQTLTNKNLSSATNTFPSSLATLTGIQTLTNKTLTSPTISNPTVTTGTFSAPAITNGTATGTALTDVTVTRGSATAIVPVNVANEAALPSSGVTNGEVATTADGNIYQRRSGAWVDALDVVQPYIFRTAGTATNLGNGTLTKVVGFSDSPFSSREAGFTYNNGDFTVAAAGMYDISGVVSFEASSTGVRRAYIYVGSDEIRRVTVNNNGAASATDVEVSVTVPLTAGAVVSLRALVNVAGLQTQTDLTNMCIVRVGA